jgi:hypothetical protein
MQLILCKNCFFKRATSTTGDEAHMISLLPFSEELEPQDIQTWLLLLVIVTIAGVSAITLALPLVHVASSNAAVLPRATPVVVAGGQCTASPYTIAYLSGSGAKTLPRTVPDDWLKAKMTEQDFANAQACAASFVDAYQTFDIANTQTLETCVKMVSVGAKSRFYRQSGGSPSEKHMSLLWRASARRYHLSQNALADVPSLIDIRSINGRVLAWMSVPYRATIKTSGREATINDYFTVLLINYPNSPSMPGMAWQVSDWRGGSAAFAPPKPL